MASIGTPCSGSPEEVKGALKIVLLANALVSSRLDYCNSLFLSLTDYELRRLQLVQNSIKILPHYRSTKKAPLATSQIQGTIQKWPHYIQNSQPRSTSLPQQINPPLYLIEKYKAKHSKTSFKPALSTVEFTNQSNTSLIPSVTMPQSFETLSPFM